MHVTAVAIAAAFIAGAGALGAQAPAAASASDTWCWSMQGGNVRGTFTTSGTLPGDGTAAAGAYTLTDASVYSSTFSDIEVGSISDGTYAFGIQPLYQIVWNGSAVTGFQRNVGGSGGTLTNGLGMYNGAGGSGAYIIFAMNYQSADTTYLFGGTQIFQSNITPALTPVPASGVCPGQPSPPPDVLEQYGRTHQADECEAGWGPSYAMWMNGGTGGWVCTRTLRYVSGRWQVV